ncbi:hypothetical protein ABZX95_17035 [Streptomyces sp. NPDC004232]
MHWSWDQLQETPRYVRRYCLDFLNAIAEAEERENDQVRAQHRG